MWLFGWKDNEMEHNLTRPTQKKRAECSWKENEHNKPLCWFKPFSIDEMHQVTGNHRQRALTQDEADDPSKVLTSKENEFVVILPKKQSPDPDGFTGIFFQTFKEGI